jgi:uncharacterized protein
MKCPACKKNLAEVSVSGLTVDVCKDGCHGIWFDNYELEKVDETHESAGEKLLDFSPPPQLNTDHSAKRSCPKCQQGVMHRFFFSVRKEVEIDECPNCGGTWLDTGELARIRAEFKTEKERKAAAEEYFSKLFDKELATLAAKSEANVQRAKRFARAFKYILPSYYIPGKQQGGAY